MVWMQGQNVSVEIVWSPQKRNWSVDDVILYHTTVKNFIMTTCVLVFITLCRLSLEIFWWCRIREKRRCKLGYLSQECAISLLTYGYARSVTKNRDALKSVRWEILGWPWVLETVMTLNKLGSMRKDGKSHPCHLPGFKWFSCPREVRLALWGSRRKGRKRHKHTKADFWPIGRKDSLLNPLCLDPRGLVWIDLDLVSLTCLPVLRS